VDAVIARAALAAALVLLALASPASAWTSTNPTSGPSNPFANVKWFVDWEWGMSQRQVLTYQARGETAKADLMMKLARNPQTKRFGAWDTNPERDVRDYLERMDAVDPGAMTWMYVYRFPHQGCAAGKASWRGKYRKGYDGGGAAERSAYEKWISGFARGIDDHRVAVFLEPDGIGTMDCLTKAGQRHRYAAFNYAIRQLNRQPNASTYIDGGASDWLPPELVIPRLKRAGIAHARGFFLNATHYDWTRNNIRYGDKLARALGGKHYVVSTSVNGRGPYRVNRKKHYYNEQRCNAPGRALGEEPSVRTASRFADAYIWIGDPGRSGGLCHGGTPAGTWWPEYALGLAARASWK
jgi:endoglucanase